MALKGTLRDFSLMDILQLIGIQKKTGVLTLKSDKEVVTVSFVEGSVVAADSLHRRLEDRLGTVLVKSGRITEAQLQEVLRIQKSTLKRMGNILVENGFIDAAALREALQIQISQMVHRLFRWRDGEYNFSQEERVDFDREHVMPMSAESLLMEGARILDEWPMIQKALGPFTTVYRRASVEIADAAPAGEAPGGGEPARGVSLNDEERAIFGLVDGRRSIQEIIERSSASEFDTCRILHDLIGRHLLDEVRAPAPAAAAPAAAARPWTLSPVALGIGYLLLLAALGGLLAHRARPTLTEWSRSQLLSAWMAPLLPRGDAEAVRGAISRSRLQRIDFALQVYYLLERGYPESLELLVTSGLVRPEGVLDPWGTPYRYEVREGGYRLAVALGPGAGEQFEILNLQDAPSGPAN